MKEAKKNITLSLDKKRWHTSSKTEKFDLNVRHMADVEERHCILMKHSINKMW